MQRQLRVRVVCIAMFAVVWVVSDSTGMAFATGQPHQKADRPEERRGIDVKAQQGDPRVSYDVRGGDGSSVTERHLASTRANRIALPPERYFVTFPTVVTQVDGTRCLQVRRRAYSDPASAAAATDAQDALWRMAVASFPACPRTAPPEANPAAQAAAFWRVAGEDLLPPPEPRIAPGYMLAGKLAYLEAGTSPTARFEHPTPLGVLIIEATSNVFVDWGDGSGVQGPYDGPGGPWPDGTITHAWTHARTYDVVVTQRWTGRWALGGASGDLSGLVTEGRLDDFPVRELQAVRNF